MKVRLVVEVEEDGKAMKRTVVLEKSLASNSVPLNLGLTLTKAKSLLREVQGPHD